MERTVFRRPTSMTGCSPIRLEDLRTPEEEPIPPNTLAELRRDMERRRLISDQIRQIEDARLGTHRASAR